MDCLAQLDALCTVAEADELPASAQVIYIHLLNINGRLHWREWFSVANSTMEKLTGLTNKTIVSAKNRLKQSGLIDYKSDGKKTTRYRIITQDTTHTTTQDTTQVITQDTTHTTTQLKMMMIDDDVDDSARAKNPFSFFANNIHPGMTQYEAEVIKNVVDEYGEEWTLHAMEIAAVNHAKSIKYVEKILMRWKESGKKEPWKDGGQNRERGMGRTNEADRGGNAEKERADSFREECRRADANQVYPWEIQNPA
jgi:DnaD/phage-associated family protein